MAYRRRSSRRSSRRRPLSRRRPRSRRYTRSRRSRFRTRRHRRALKPQTMFSSNRLVKMTYTLGLSTSTGTMTAAQINLLNQALRMKANSIYRPNGNYGSSPAQCSMNPSSFNYFSTLYNQSEVKSSSYKLTYRQVNTTQCTPFVLGVKQTDTTTMTDHAYEQLASESRVKYTIVRPRADGTATATIRCGFKAHKRFATAEAKHNIANPVGSDPTDVEYFLPFMCFLDDTSTSFPACHFVLKVTYWVLFSDPKDIHDITSTMALDQE